MTCLKQQRSQRRQHRYDGLGPADRAHQLAAGRDAEQSRATGKPAAVPSPDPVEVWAMNQHVCPWWGGYFIDNWVRRWIHNPEQMLSPFVRPGMTAMDFGCGMGMFAIALAKLVGEQGRVIAIDLQQKMLDVLVKRAQRANVAERIHAHHCGADSIGFYEAAAVDFALAFYSVHEVSDHRRLLGEIWACLRPSGQMLLIEPKMHVAAHDFENMVSLAEELGFGQDQRPRIRLSRAVVLHRR
jgi:SAM-dependent methyltransferase